jgi:Methyltransferase domain
MQFNPLNFSLCLMQPRRLKITAWSEHIPFALALIQMIKPRILVELGVHTGESYCAFCQAVDVLHLDTACYRVDTWCGDEHCGRYEDTVLQDLRSHHDPLYGRFSHLLRKTFDEAVNDSKMAL